MKNTKLRKFKCSSLEKKMNNIVIKLLFIMTLSIFFIAIYSVCIRMWTFDFILIYYKQKYDYGLQIIQLFLSYYLILNTILPISLIITLNMTRLV